MLAVVLTGTGGDGAAGSRAVKLAGGTVVVQDEAASAAFGMASAGERPAVATEFEPLLREVERNGRSQLFRDRPIVLRRWPRCTSWPPSR